MTLSKRIKVDRTGTSYAMACNGEDENELNEGLGAGAGAGAKK